MKDPKKFREVFKPAIEATRKGKGPKATCDRFQRGRRKAHLGRVLYDVPRDEMNCAAGLVNCLFVSSP